MTKTSYIQDVMCKDMVMPVDTHIFSKFEELERLYIRHGNGSIFCSVNMAKILKNKNHPLHKNVFVNFDFLRYSYYTSYINKKELIFNENYVIMCAGSIEEQMTSNSNWFIKPDGSEKIFTGDIFTKDKWLHLLDTIDVYPHTLCIVAEARPTPEYEIRTWIIEGSLKTWALYSWNQHYNFDNTEINVKQLRRTIRDLISDELCMHEDSMVMDFTPDYKLIEINGLSTSGFYKGMDVGRLIQETNNIIIDV